MSSLLSPPMRSLALVGGQALAALALIAGMAFAPPAQGKMLLLPLTDRGSAETARIALNHGAKLLGQGPIAGSLVVLGEASALAVPLLQVGVVALAAPPALCGVGDRDGKAI